VYRALTLAVLIALSGSVWGHQFTPTYPTWKRSFIPGILVVTMTLFNSREEISYYQINVYDKAWKKLPFASSDRLSRIEYLETKKIEVYLKVEDVDKALYICSRSKLTMGSKQASHVSSKICSKLVGVQ
tara:strand:+ start:726 stop:1112 length:387 start_codon:yes stop_codon:yes gene_type:complete